MDTLIVKTLEIKKNEKKRYENWETIQIIGENLVMKKLENMYYECFERREPKNDITKLIEQIKGI